jgi:hypothetical protein
MWRTYGPALALGASILAGTALVYLFLLGTVGTSTMLLVAFAFAAFGLTASVLHWPGDDATDDPSTDMRR